MQAKDPTTQARVLVQTKRSLHSSYDRKYPTNTDEEEDEDEEEDISPELAKALQNLG